MEVKNFYNITKSEDINPKILEPIKYHYKDKRDIDIIIKQPEFTSVCPMTGLPDYGTITIKYVPNLNIIELKSLKYYFLQFRNVGIFYEHLVNKILDDFVQIVKPKKAELIGDFTSRGGISTQAIAKYEEN